MENNSLIVTADEEKKTRLDISRIKILMMNSKKITFFIGLLMRMPIKITREIPTAAVDGKFLFINPDFWFKLKSQDEKIFLLLHEVSHIAYDHMGRRLQREPKKWNDACDYVINAFLSDAGFRMPDEVTLDENGVKRIVEIGLLDSKYDGMSAEQIYELLEKDPDYKPSNMGDILPPATQDPVQRQHEIHDMLAQAATQADMANDAGSVPQEIRRLLDRLKQPLINWKVALQRFLFDLAPNNYSWQRPRKRYIPLGMYLPQVQGTKVGQVDFAIDVSGSISEDDFNQFCSEVFGVFKQTKPEKIRLIQFDHQIQDISVVRSVKDLLAVKFKGGGGTYLEPVMQDALQSKAKALIVLTDGQFNTNITDPKKPVIWAVFNNPNWEAPFGSVIHFKFKPS